MKGKIFLVAIAVALISLANGQEDDSAEWNAFKAKFKKSYESMKEEEERYYNILINIHVVC